MAVRRDFDRVPERAPGRAWDAGRSPGDGAGRISRMSDRAMRRPKGRTTAERDHGDAAFGRGARGWRFALRPDGGRIVHPTTGRSGRRRVRRSAGPQGGIVVRGQHGRQSAGAEIREQVDQRIEDAEQHQADTRPEEAHDHALVTPRRNVLAHVVQDDSQVGIGVKRDGVGHERS
jgi:hypothetical protein